MWKKVTAIICLIPVVWFTLDLTGLSLGNSVIVVSCFVDEPIDVVFWLIAIAAWLSFVLKERFGKYILATWMTVWAGAQLSMYGAPQERIASYNNFFASEGTFYLFKPSDTVLVKDFYHTVLDVMLVLAFVAIIIYILRVILKKRKQDESIAK